MNKIILYLNPINWFYFCKGHLKSILVKQQKKALSICIERASICPECAQNGECLQCGCSIPEVWYSDKICEPYKKYILKNE